MYVLIDCTMIGGGASHTKGHDGYKNMTLKRGSLSPKPENSTGGRKENWNIKKQAKLLTG